MSDRSDSIKWRTVARVHCFSGPSDVLDELGRRAQAGGAISELKKAEEYRGTKEIVGNLALNAGLNHLIDIIAGLNPSAIRWDSSHAYIGVGDDGGAAVATQMQLEAERNGTNYQYVAMDAGFPMRTASIDGHPSVKYRASFLSGVACWGWAEWCVANGNGAGKVLLNRKAEVIGTKPAFDLWIFETELVFG
jgi:hypothetical protein